MLEQSRSRLAGTQTVFALVCAAAMSLAGGRGAVNASSILSVSPSAVVFSNTTVGTFDYQMVTVSNTGTDGDYIATADAVPNPPFFPTFAGTCNTSIGPSGANYWIPAGESCTFQWGFHPSKPGKQSGVGTLSFASGATASVTLTGKGTPH